MSDEKGQIGSIGFAMNRTAALQKTKEEREARKRNRMATVKTGNDSPPTAKLEAVVAVETGEVPVELARDSEPPRQSRPFETDDTQKAAVAAPPAPPAEPVREVSRMPPPFSSKKKTIEAQGAPDPNAKPAERSAPGSASPIPVDATEDDGTSRTVEMELPAPIVRDSRPSPAPAITEVRNPFSEIGRVANPVVPVERVILTPEEPTAVPRTRRRSEDTETLVFRVETPRTFKIGSREFTVPDLVAVGIVALTLVYVFVR